MLVEKSQPALHEEFARLNLEIVPSGFLANLDITPTLENEIKAAQLLDAGILNIKKNIESGKANCVSVNDAGVVYFSDHLVVIKSGDVKDRKSVV